MVRGVKGRSNLVGVPPEAGTWPSDMPSVRDLPVPKGLGVVTMLEGGA
jgi:hypothetical protein